MAKLTAALIVLLAVMFGSFSQAQEQQPPNPMYFMRAACDTSQKMVDLVTTQYKEEILFIGEGMTFEARSGRAFTGGLIFTTNQDSGTWSVIQLFGDGIACMIMNGNNFTPYDGGPLK